MSKVLQDEFHLTLRSGITIYPAQSKKINAALADLLNRAPAQFVLLLDVTGQVISSLGQQEQVDLVSLGSLVAGDLAASHEIARLTNQYQANQLVLREGQNTHTFILEAGQYLALFVQISDEVPLGWARMLIQQVARQLTEIVAQPPDDVGDLKNRSDLQPALNDALPDLFDDALDELWQE
ncbi:MAG: roadblock/LC7 domain-containing protein [Chloroflexota bacterium]